MFDTDIHTAVWNRDIGLVNMFLDIDPKKMSNAQDTTEFGELMTPLHYAAYQGDLEITTALLNAGAAVNAKTKLGFTPLFYGAQRGHLDICSALMSAGANPSITGSDEEHPEIVIGPADHIVDTPGLAEILGIKDTSSIS